MNSMATGQSSSMECMFFGSEDGGSFLSDFMVWVKFETELKEAGRRIAIRK